MSAHPDSDSNTNVNGDAGHVLSFGGDRKGTESVCERQYEPAMESLES
jgi:hypothetical protein